MRQKTVSLLQTTQNTRDLGGYRTENNSLTLSNRLLRSDIQNFPCEEDFEYLMSHGITTIIDMRGQKDVERKPSGFAGKEGFTYYNFQIDEGSGVPDSMEEFLRLFREKYGDTNNYFKGMGLSSIEIEKLRKKLYEY